MEFQYYFQSFNNYFWQWEEDFEITAIPKENTIAYKDFLKDILQFLTPQGIPSFGSLLLVTIATNPKGEKSLDIVYSIINNWMNKYSLTNENIINEAISLLKQIASLPESYKTGNNRMLLFQAIFEKSHNLLSSKNAKDISFSIQHKNYFSNIKLNNTDVTEAILIKDFRPLAIAKNRFPTNQILIDKIANLPKVNTDEINISKILENEIQEPKDFIDELILNTKTFHIGTLIRRIWSGMNIPAHANTPSQQPIGGISDLTNKGDYDKLLISEFANDDIVFLSRLANNEALFIQREIPKSTSNLRRTILIDITIKSWGTPKTIAYAIMLAIAKHPKTTIGCDVYLIGQQYQLISINSIEDIIENIDKLDGSISPSLGLELLLKELPLNKNNEVFLITEISMIKNASLLKVINDFHSKINYWIYTDVEGNIEIYKKIQSSKKQIANFQIPINELWEKSKLENKKIAAKINGETEYPILFKNPSNTKKTITTSSNEIFKVSNNKKLYRLYNLFENHHTKGWEVIYEDIPFVYGKIEIGKNATNEWILLLYHPSIFEVTLINITTKKIISTILIDRVKYTIQKTIFINDHFLLLDGTKCLKISCTGNIEEYSLSMLEKNDIENQETTALANEKKHSYKLSVFKNIKDIFINNVNNIVLNTHELSINSDHHIKLNPTKFLINTRKSTKISDYKFQFNDGSTIEINTAGMLILQSSNEEIPTIFIPTIIDASLGVATEKYFSGNNYFKKEKQFQVILENSGPNKIKIIKSLVDNLELGLRNSQIILDNLPQIIVPYCSEKYAEQLKKIFENQKAIVTIKELDINIEQSSIPPSIFFNNFITPFIQQILQHGI